MQLTLNPDVAIKLIRYQLTRYRLLTKKQDGVVVTQAEAGERIGVKQPTIAGFEAGSRLPSQAQLELLLDFYGQRKQFAKMRQVRDVAAIRNRGESVPIGLLSDVELLIGLEYFANHIEVYEPNVITGLLQIERYARAILETYAHLRPNAAIDEALRVRITRQAVLSRGDGEDDDTPLNLTMYIEESALRRQIGGPEVLAEQLDFLLEIKRRSNITIRVIPSSVVYHPAMGNQFTVLSFEDDWKVAYTEDVQSAHYYDGAAALDNAGRLMTGLHRLSLSPRESRRLISDIREELASP